MLWKTLVTMWKEWVFDNRWLEEIDTEALTVIGLEDPSSMAIPFIVKATLGAMTYENLWVKVQT